MILQTFSPSSSPSSLKGEEIKRTLKFPTIDLIIKTILLTFFSFSVSASLLFAQRGFDKPVFKAMEDEMNRSMKKLRFEKFTPPYFISYQILESSETLFTARYGSVVQDQFLNNRYFYIELRYGDYEIDNTDDNYRGIFDSAPLEDDTEAIRHSLWLMTDRAYKQAIKDYLQKQGKKVSQIEKEKIDDFSKEKPHQTAISDTITWNDSDNYKTMLKECSSILKKTKEILESGITLRANHRILYALNSEGTKVEKSAGGNPFFIYIWARTQSADGMNLESYRTFSVRSSERLPVKEKVEGTVEEMSRHLLLLRQAKLADPYTAPAILDPESTGVLFHEALGHRLEGERQRDEDEGQTFKGQVGKEIIPAFLTLIDDPTLFEWEGTELNGFYTYDEENVKAQKVTLVEKGILRNYLMSRRPISGFSHSNGHGRAQFGRDPIGRMSNLLVKSEKEFSDEVLKKMLLEECSKQKKPYGLIIRRTRSGDTTTGRGQYQAFRGTPEEVLLVDAKTGTETLVRGVEMMGTPLLTINKIIATGNRYEVSNAFCGAESGNVGVSSIMPSVLVREIELQRLREDKQRPPILPPPLYDK